jgi:hypothetical protein
MVVAFLVSSKSGNKATAFAVAIGFTAVFVLVSNRNKVFEGIEVREARMALQGVADLAGIEKAARENPSNHILGLTTEAFRSAQETERLTNKLSADIEPAGLAADLNPAAASLEQLQAYQRDFRTAEANANAALPVYIDLLKKERATVERFAQLNGTSGGETLRGFLEGIDIRHARSTDFNSKMLAAKAKLYKALADRYAIFIEQYGRFQLQPNGFVFSDRSVLARFNATIDPINDALKRIAELEEERKQLQKSQQERLKGGFGSQ